MFIKAVGLRRVRSAAHMFFLTRSGVRLVERQNARRNERTVARSGGAPGARSRTPNDRSQPVRSNALLLVQEISTSFRAGQVIRPWNTGLLWLHCRMVASPVQPTQRQREEIIERALKIWLLRYHHAEVVKNSEIDYLKFRRLNYKLLFPATSYTQLDT